MAPPTHTVLALPKDETQAVEPRYRSLDRCPKAQEQYRYPSSLDSTPTAHQEDPAPSQGNPSTGTASREDRSSYPKE